MRNLAEFENFRNRSEKEKSAMFEIGAKSVVEKMLPVVDNLERGFDGLSDEEKEFPTRKRGTSVPAFPAGTEKEKRTQSG